MDVSLAVQSFRDGDDLARIARAAAIAGFTSLELPIASAGSISVGAPPAVCHDWSKQIVDAGLRVSALVLPPTPDSHLASDDPTDRRRAYDRSIAAFDRAAWLGTTRAVLTPAIVGGPPHRRPCGRYEEIYQRAVESLLVLRFEAQQRGIHVACSTCHTRFLLSPMEARAFIDRVNSPFVGMSLDLGALLAMGEPPDWIASLGHRVFHVVLTDGRSADATRNCDPGDGDVDWPAVRDALVAARYDGPLTSPTSNSPDDAMRRIERALAPAEN